MGVEPTQDGSTAPQTVLKTAPVTGPGAAPRKLGVRGRQSSHVGGRLSVLCPTVTGARRPTYEMRCLSHIAGPSKHQMKMRRPWPKVDVETKA